MRTCRATKSQENACAHDHLILTYRIIFGLLAVCMADYFQLISADGYCNFTFPL